MEEHTDYFGEIIEPGDTVIRPMHSELQTEKVARLTPKAIYFERTDQWSIKRGLGPLRISINNWWNTSNLIKLKNNGND
jgi:hypothetical protein